MPAMSTRVVPTTARVGASSRSRRSARSFVAHSSRDVSQRSAVRKGPGPQSHRSIVTRRRSASAVPSAAVPTTSTARDLPLSARASNDSGASTKATRPARVALGPLAGPGLANGATPLTSVAMNAGPKPQQQGLTRSTMRSTSNSAPSGGDGGGGGDSENWSHVGGAHNKRLTLSEKLRQSSHRIVALQTQLREARAQLQARGEGGGSRLETVAERGHGSPGDAEQLAKQLQAAHARVLEEQTARRRAEHQRQKDGKQVEELKAALAERTVRGSFLVGGVLAC